MKPPPPMIPYHGIRPHEMTPSGHTSAWHYAVAILVFPLVALAALAVLVVCVVVVAVQFVLEKMLRRSWEKAALFCFTVGAFAAHCGAVRTCYELARETEYVRHAELPPRIDEWYLFSGTDAAFFWVFAGCGGCLAALIWFTYWNSQNETCH